MTVSPHIPGRTCVGCFKKFNQGKLLAVTRLKDDVVMVDIEQKLPGRSAYLCFNKSCFEKAKRRKGKNGLQFGLKVAIPAQIWKEIEDIIQN